MNHPDSSVDQMGDQGPVKQKEHLIESQEAYFQTHLLHLLHKWPPKSQFTSLSFSFLVHEMGTNEAPPSGAAGRF